MLKQKKKNNYKSSGFTLIELLTSITIIGIISTIFLVNYRASEERSKLSMATQKVGSDIRLAQSYSLGSNKFNGNFPLGGWGAHFDLANPYGYVIFADVDASKSYDVSEEFKEIILPSGVKLDSFSLVAASADIVFAPPDPATYINGVDNNQIEIYFVDKNNSKKSVLVNFLGLIDIL